METLPVYVGVDYHNRGVQVCVVEPSGRVAVNRKVGNSVAEVLGALPPGVRVERAAIESCCGAADLAEQLRAAPGWPITLAHPGFVRRMKHNPDKTDYADARMLAELSRAGFVPPVWLAPRGIRELRLLVRLRADLVGRVRAIKTRMLGVLRAQRIVEPALPIKPGGKKGPGRWTRAWLAWLRGEAAISPAGHLVIRTHLDEWADLRARIKTVEEELDRLTRDDAVVARLLEEPGVGKITAWTMRALIGDFARFRTGKQLARFCAVTPRNASSGERAADAGLIRAGDPLLRNVVIEAAHRLRRSDPRWSKLSDQMEERGKPVSVIVAAVANRWVRWLFHQVKNPAGVREEATPQAAA